MKKLYVLIVILLVCTFNSRAQIVQLNQDFTTGNPITGWLMQNNSVPVGPLLWSQGNGTIFPAYSGAPNDYVCANYAAQGNGPGGISLFLITPTVSLMNGGIFQYATRTVSNPAQYADRMQVLLSFGAGNGAITGGTTSVGTFTGMLNNINPNLTSTGYPDTWTVYTHTLINITGTITGRFAFRYFVSDAGPNGSNSSYIGVDDVKYTMPTLCVPPNITITPSSQNLCGNGSVTLTATGASNYTWSTGSTSSVLVVSPASATTYSIVGNNIPSCESSTLTTIGVFPQPTVSASNATACPGASVTLTANGASTYSWSNGSTGSSIVATGNGALTIFTVTGYNAPDCSHSTTVSVSSNTFLLVPTTNITACPDVVLVLGASGATSYNWSTGATTPSIVVTPTASGSYVVTGFNGSCSESKVITVTVDLNLFAPNFTTCAGTSATLIATGANGYNWSTGGTTSMVVVSPTAATTVYTVTGTSGSCSQTRTISVKLGTNLSVGAIQNCIGNSILLTGYGASSYTWNPGNDHNSSIVVTPTAPTIYTLSGISGTCSGTATLQISYCSGVEELQFSDKSAKLYPNPFNGELTIANATGEVRIIDISGKVILITTVEESTVINTDSFAPGMYIVIITNTTNLERQILKVIKN